MNKDNLPRIYLARHCKTVWNLEGRLVGTTDLPLCAEGLAEAKTNLRSIETLGITRIISSNLKRAHETAKIYSEHLRVPLETNSGLREIDHGIWNGQKLIELLNDPKPTDFKRWFNNPAAMLAPEAGESIPEAQRRIVETIKKIAIEYTEETVMVVMHKHIRSILRCTILGIGLNHFRENIDDSVEPVEIPKEEIDRLFEIKF